MEMILLTNFDTARLMEGHPMTFRTDEDQEVCVSAAERTETGGYVMDQAESKGLPILEPSDFSLRHILRGGMSRVPDRAGYSYLMRLATAVELMELVREAGKRLEADGLPAGPGMTPEQAEQLTRTY